MDLKFWLISIFYGLLPESLFFTLFFIYAKKLTEKRVLLFLLIFIVDILSVIIFKFSVWYNFTFMASMFFILILLYKSQFIDIFLVSSSSILLALISGICYFGIPNYWLAAIINRVLIFLVLFLIRNKLSVGYRFYCRIWNKNSGVKVKSITVRTFSMIVLNLFLYGTSLFMVYLGQKYMN